MKLSNIADKIKASGTPTVSSHEEYERLKAAQWQLSYAKEDNAARRNWKRIGIAESEAGLNWQAVKPGISDGMKALEAVKPAYEQGYGIVFLHGNWGQGKTLIGKILIATAIRAGKNAAYANVSDALDDIRLAFDAEHQSTELLKRMDWWSSLDVLFLDELDKANQTPWAQDQLFKLLDKRYTLAVRESGLTVIASNSNVDQLDGYLQSRIHDARVGTVVHLQGADAREVMPKGIKY